MSVLVTGGAGFIGSNVLASLNRRGIDSIYVVDDLGTTEKWKNLVGKQFIDILSKKVLFEWLQQQTPSLAAIIHLGACSSTTETDAGYLLENNTHYSMRLATYAMERDIRFIYASSAATYGNGALGFSDARLEEYVPLNMYGYSKHLFDLWVKQQGWLDRVVGLKYFNVFGPNEWHKGQMASAIVKMVRDLQQTGKISLFKSSDAQFADGDQVRDFIYVKDAAEMTVQFLDSDQSGIYNVGRGIAATWNALAQATLSSVNRLGTIQYVDMPPVLQGNYQNYTCATMEKSKSAKLYLPRFSLEEAVKDYVQGYVLPQRYL